MSQETDARQRKPLNAGVAVRRYRDEDWSAICRIHDRARPDELKGSSDPRAFVPIEEDSEVEDLRRANKIVATEGDRVAGFVGIDGTCLAWLYVDPDHYGRGIGRALLQRGLGEIGPRAWTIVLDGNIRARRLYESEGFEEARQFDSKNAGYPCRCIRMERVVDESTHPSATQAQR